MAMATTFTLVTHDAWGAVTVGSFGSLDEARQAFVTLCQDPWYRRDGAVKGVELVQHIGPADRQRLDWFAFC
jgi:hypothetical protein